ncbi:DUF86 domain-containing protein [uncultured Endozoicomonas sp.]|uniref:type VII toxin-antitoxin system HepT family RNase toxin n=1 Tax=uncultured Endozoicomonas sp. TaxID=432652 RepID=UPI0026058A03|nr:DUF86 domain-containing protein [uncultured Endozoicomonas sp.]
MDDVILNKHTIIGRSLKRVAEEYHGKEGTIATDFAQQDSVILNIQRVCQAVQDIANRVIRLKQLGVPKSARESFSLLADSKTIPPELAETLTKMVGFRNIAVHEYQKLNIDILRAVIDKHLSELKKFADLMLVLE